MSDTPAASRRGRWLVIGLAVLFMGPLAAAWIMYFSGDWAPGATSNKGELITPPRPLPEAPLTLAGGGTTDGNFPHGAWTLYLRTSDGCGESCRDRLYLMRQSHIALGKEAERVRRVLLVEGAAPDTGWLAGEHPDLLVVQADGEDAAALLGAFPAAGPETADVIYLSDPLGNLMMRYPVEGDDRRILDDLKKLLKLSRIG